MGFNDLLTAVRELSSEERAILRIEIEKIDTGYVNSGVSAEQWESVKRTQKLVDEGKMPTRPGREVMDEIIERLK